MAKKKTTTAKPTTKAKNTVIGKYTEKQLIKLGEELVAYVSLPDVYHLVEWTESKGKCFGWWQKLKQKHKVLVPYHERAKQILGNKILKNAFQCNNSWAIQTFIPKYLGDVKDHLKEQEEEKLERQMRLEKYRNELGQKSHDEAKAKIDAFDVSMDLMAKLLKYEKLLKENGILEDIEE